MLELFDLDLRRNPYDFYARMRQDSPVLRLPEDIWAVFDYQSVKRALSDAVCFSSEVTPPTGKAPDWLVFSDPPRHSSLRALLTSAFTPASIAALEPRVGEISAELLAAPRRSGRMDLVGDYAGLLPNMVISELIGIPLENRQRFLNWSEAILGLSYAVLGMEAAASALSEHAAAKDEMQDYLYELLEIRRELPREDLISRLATAEVEGEQLSLEQILGFFQLLLAAGTETTTNAISNGILSLLEHPDQLARLRAEPALLPLAIEEIVRYRSPGHAMFRQTRQEVELHGQRIPAGKLVLVMIGSANRDPEHFDQPDRFDIGRDPNEHIAFGQGLHYCLGSALARLELRIALTDLLALEEMVLEDPLWQPRRALHMHGPLSLPIRFKPVADRL